MAIQRKAQRRLPSFYGYWQFRAKCSGGYHHTKHMGLHSDTILGREKKKKAHINILTLTSLSRQ